MTDLFRMTGKLFLGTYIAAKVAVGIAIVGGIVGIGVGLVKLVG